MYPYLSFLSFFILLSSSFFFPPFFVSFSPFLSDCLPLSSSFPSLFLSLFLSVFLSLSLSLSPYLSFFLSFFPPWFLSFSLFSSLLSFVLSFYLSTYHCFLLSLQIFYLNLEHSSVPSLSLNNNRNGCDQSSPNHRSTSVC